MRNKPVLILKHIDIEGPGTLSEFLERHHLRYLTSDLYKASAFPENPEDYSAVISLGGPMNVYEEERYPFLRWENDFLQRALMSDVPLLGICLGAQLIAKAAGARVGKNPVKEIGWFDVSLTDEGLRDEVFKGLGNKLRVFQWHGDTFEIPEGGRRLASSPLCPNQAFRWQGHPHLEWQGHPHLEWQGHPHLEWQGHTRRAYGLQFHLEVDPGMIAQWVEAYKEELGSLSEPISPEKLLWEARTQHKLYHAQAMTFYRNFFRLAQLIS